MAFIALSPIACTPRRRLLAGRLSMVFLFRSSCHAAKNKITLPLRSISPYVPHKCCRLCSDGVYFGSVISRKAVLRGEKASGCVYSAGPTILGLDGVAVSCTLVMHMLTVSMHFNKQIEQRRRQVLPHCPLCYDKAGRYYRTARCFSMAVVHLSTAIN